MFRMSLSADTRKALLRRLQQAYAAEAGRLARRIHAILWVVDGKSVGQVADDLDVGEQTVRDWLHAFLLNGIDSLFYRVSTGRPPKLTDSQRRELRELITAGPEAAEYPSGCWTSVMIADLIRLRFKVDYNPHYVPRLLKVLGFSYQKGKFESDHLSADDAIIWLEETWPEIVRLAKERDAVIFFGDEVGFAQWGSLGYTWSLVGVQPTVKTSGKRKSYRVFGLLDCFTGQLLYKGTAGKLNSQSYAEFLTEVLAKVDKHIILIQDNASYHTSGAIQDFFDKHADRLTVYQLPPYSPELNPIEFLWRRVKRQATHLRWFPLFDNLTHEVDETLSGFAGKPQELTELAGVYRELTPAAA